MNSHQIAEAQFGAIEWIDADHGYIKCPGESLHSEKTAKRDCKISLDGAPTVFCFHSSCSGVIEKENYKLRVAIAKNEAPEKREISQAERAKMEIAAQKKEYEARIDAAKDRGMIILLDKYDWPCADIWEDSPVRLDDGPENDHKLLLSLFQPSDVVWIGQVKETGTLQYAKQFRTAQEWIEGPPIGNFTCGSVFKPGSYSRSNENIVAKRFLVVESDTLGQDEIGSIFRWCRKFMTLRAVVNTAGKSLHGWFDYPEEGVAIELKPLLTRFHCDRALFTHSQPVRLPGAKRGDKTQSLLWLSN